MEYSKYRPKMNQEVPGSRHHTPNMQDTETRANLA